nr:MAG TPA: hypothetical protein [Caudoviricetes sp.]
MSLYSVGLHQRCYYIILCLKNWLISQNTLFNVSYTRSILAVIYFTKKLTTFAESRYLLVSSWYLKASDVQLKLTSEYISSPTCFTRKVDVLFCVISHIEW